MSPEDLALTDDDHAEPRVLAADPCAVGWARCRATANQSRTIGPDNVAAGTAGIPMALGRGLAVRELLSRI